MKLIRVDTLPKKNVKKRVQEFIKEFADSDMKIAKVDFTERDYKSPRVCYSCIGVAIRRSKRPVRVCMRGDEVYLTKL